MTDEGIVSRGEILPLLGTVKRQGQWLFAYCPAHDDGSKHNGKSGQSLGLSDAGVLRCFAGCRFADVMAKLREGRRKSGPATSPRDSRGWPPNPVTAYEYRSLTGDLIAVKGRFERPNPDGGKPEKTFRWRLPEGTYDKGLGGYPMADMPLWDAAEIAAADPSRPVWFAEGESATAAIRARNQLATCGAWGASQRSFGSAFEVLRGRDVMLWPDNDVPGREYMEAVRRALLQVARSVAVVAAPVPPKGDAVEYFQAGGTIEDLLANVLIRPTVDVVAPDRFIVRVPTPAGPVAFDFAHLTRIGGSFDCELTVSVLTPGAEPEPYNQRINLLSSSARQALETALGRQFGKGEVNWTTTLSMAYARVRAAYLETDRAVQIGQLPTTSDKRFLIETILPEGQPTVMFADGSSGKTMLTYAMALAIALGGDFCGLAVQPGGVLIVDYESSLARFRLNRLLDGKGTMFTLDQLPIHYWDARGIPLVDQVDALTRAIQKLDISLVVVDSGGAACGGEPEKAAIALEYFNALARLKVTTLTICHISKAETETASLRPFGSTFWHNMARRTWYVQRDQDEESDDMEATMFCRKVNDGRRPRPIGFRFEFDGDEGPIRLYRAEFRSTEVSAAESVTNYLRQLTEPVTILQIANETGLANDSVKTALYRGEKTGAFQKVIGGEGRSNQVRWRAG